MSWSGRADYKRWSSSSGLEAWWDERTQRLAALVPVGSQVIEFGAGRRQLERYLPANCHYTPSDLVDRGTRTLVLDLNTRPLPFLPQLPGVAVFGGVLEYISDVRGLVQWLAESGVTLCVASFDPVPKELGNIARYRELNRRLYYGYMNHLTEDQLVQTFEAAKFRCVHRQAWTTQVIFQFHRLP
jgi:hypothetical protein